MKERSEDSCNRMRSIKVQTLCGSRRVRGRLPRFSLIKASFRLIGWYSGARARPSTQTIEVVEADRRDRLLSGTFGLEQYRRTASDSRRSDSELRRQSRSAYWIQRRSGRPPLRHSENSRHHWLILTAVAKYADQVRYLRGTIETPSRS